MAPLSSPGPRSFLFLLDVLEAGGVQRDILKIGAALGERGDRCTVAAFRSSNDAMSPRYRAAGLEVEFLEKRGRFDPAFLSRLRRLIGSGGFDVVQALSPQAAFWAACVLPFGRRPLFASYLFNTHSFDRWLPRAVESLYTARRLDAVFTNSHAGARYYRGAVASPPLLCTVRNGVEPPPVSASRRAARRKLGITENDFALATVGRLVPVKRQADAIRAVAGRIASGEGPRLFLLGDGPLRAELEALCRTLGIEESVVFLGGQDDIRNLLPAFDVFLLTSDSEGMPNALLEAMSAGLACVATRVGGVPEIIESGRNGILVPPGDPKAIGEAVGELMSDAGYRARLGREAARRVAENFTAERMTRDLLGSYDAMLSARQADVAFVFSQFPRLSELFLVREVAELERRGKSGCIVSLKPSTDRVIHATAQRLLPRRVAFPWLGVRVLWANARLFGAHPWRYLGALGELTRMHWRHGREFWKCLAAWPKTVAAARVAEARGVRHVHAMWATVPASMGLVMARLLKCRFSFSAHAFDIYGCRHPLAKKIRKAEFVATCTQRNVEYLRSLVGEEAGRRVHLVRHFSAAPHSVEAGAIGQETNSPVPVLLSVGSLERYKGHEVLLRAAGELRERGHAFTLHIVGGGSEAGTLAELAESLGLDGMVKFLGPLPQGRVLREYRAASVFALASIRVPGGGEDNLPNVLVEAALCGVPSVVSDVGAVREFVEDGKSGILVEPGDVEALADGLERILTDGPLRTQIGEAARRRAEAMFDRERTLAIFDHLLDLALAGNEDRAGRVVATEA